MQIVHKLSHALPTKLVLLMMGAFLITGPALATSDPGDNLCWKFRQFVNREPVWSYVCDDLPATNLTH